MSTLRVSNIEAKADPSSPSVDEKLKFTNSNGDVLFHLDGKTSGITTVGVNTTSATFSVDNNQNVEFLGIVTATKFSLSGGGEITGGDANFTGIVTAGSISVTGNVSVGGTLTYEDVTSIDSIGIITARGDVHVGAGLSVVGVSTLGNTIVGGATTELIVGGDARITGILTIGTSSITLDGTTNQVNVGSGVTIHHTNGIQVGENILHSSGLTINSFLGTPELAGISSSISDTAVDIFIYDTSKDSDGGAWRHRTSHTSWYNETLNTATRGSRREFPAVAVIVAETSSITIYDGDDPDLPMWIVFNGANSYETHLGNVNGVTSVAMLNGVMIHGGAGYDGHVTNFLTDSTRRYGASTYHKQTISKRNDTTTGNWYGSTVSLAGNNRQINDVAMTVLPNAPIDSATGLPIPTIAFATDGGVSVIKDDGTVISTSGSGYYVKKINFTKDYGLNVIITNSSNGNWINAYVNDYTTINGLSYITYNNFDGVVYRTKYDPKALTYLTASVNDTISNFISLDGRSNAIGGAAIGGGLTILEKSPRLGFDPDSGIVAFATTSYNTGWMHGDIKGAFLSGISTASVTGSELITNGDSWTGASGSTPPTGWTGGNGATFDVIDPGNPPISGDDGVVLRLINAGSAQGGPNSYMYTSFTTVVGQSYTLSLVNYWNATITVGYKIGTSANGSENATAFWVTAYGDPTVRVIKDFVATATTTYLTLFISSGTNAYGTLWDDVSIRPSDPDRSVNAKGLQVFGTITKSAVATGAELVAYGPFTDSNYLRQPYNSDLNFGTGAFSSCFWIKPYANTPYMRILNRITDVNNKRWEFYTDNNSDNMVFYTRDGGNASFITINNAIPLNVWTHICGVRETNGDLKLYVNGVLRGTSAIGSGNNTAIRDLTSSIANLLIGNAVDWDADKAFNGQLSLVRISQSAPSAEQIKKIYEDEKVLFQENAACTLYGSSDAVTALAYDEVTERLHVGTSSGRSEFQGLRRINNTTTAVTTAISAYDSFVVEQ